ncbi:hypothetical protein AB1L42_20030 [Thalassoglobus sp. JC818]|uniref:hypothetical protein n=1 Tax=Thalassoglobus sp. JC818 TaxID=3232136 RepID=UPI0034580511
MHALKSFACLSAVALMFQGSNAVLAQTGDGTTSQEVTFEDIVANAPPIHRVEEDWELVVNNPDPNADCPQIATVFGPTDARFDTHTLFELNHGTLPSFGEGGMQLQVWFGDYLIGYQRQRAPAELSTSNERITYTTATAIEGGHLTMSVFNGSSTTFGSFGESNALKVWLFTNRDDLNPYHPGNSIEHSKVTFGANRVDYFKRSAIRFYDEDGDLYAQDLTDRYVHRLAAD